MEAPKDIVRAGVNRVIKVVRLAGNSLSFRTAFSLDTSGGPNFPHIVVYLHSCLIRTAHKTVSGHEVLHNSLLRAGIEALSSLNTDIHMLFLLVGRGLPSVVLLGLPPVFFPKNSAEVLMVLLFLVLFRLRSISFLLPMRKPRT